MAAAPGGDVFALYPSGLVRHGPGRADGLPLPFDPARSPPRALASAPDGTVWVRTGATCYRRRPDGEWAETDEGEPQPAPIGDLPPAVHRAIRFRDGIWGATRTAGIVRRRLEPRFRTIALPHADRVHALARTPDGAIWCGTENGLARVDGETIEALPAIDGTALGTVTALAVDREGRLWVGSGSSFTGVYRRDDHGWTKLDAIDGYVHRITLDPSGALWFAALNAEGGTAAEGRGAWSFSDGTFKPAPANVVLPSRRVYDVVARDPSGVLWFATLKGLAAYEGPERVTHYGPDSGLAGEKVWCLCAGRDGSLWIGYQVERGVSRLASGQFTHFGVEDGLCDGNVWTIVEGRRGVFWFATEGGVSRYDGVRWSCFRDEEGLGLAPIWPLLPLPDGSLLVGTLGAGLVHVRTDDTEAPRTRFRHARAQVRAGDALEVRWQGTDAWFDTPAADLVYRWRLDGGRWSEASRETSASLAPGPGRHVLEVQALDRFGNAENPPAALPFEVLAREGTPWPFYAAVGALLAALGFVIGRRARAGS